MIFSKTWEAMMVVGEQGDLLGPEDAEIFENIANRMDQDDVLFGPKWLENFKEIK